MRGSIDMSGSNEIGDYLTSNDSLKIYKKQAIEAARNLHYPPEVISKIKKCNSMGQVSIVMTSARQTYL
jgi:hypothetical protein